MKCKNGPWTIKESALKFQNDFLELHQDQVIQPDGAPGVYATVTLKAGAAVLAVDEENAVYLTRQFRYALGHESLEVVSGAVEAGETRSQTAQRELREELGIEAGEFRALGELSLDTSIIKAPVSLFLASKLTFVEPQREGTETIQTVKMSLAEAVCAVLQGQIVHGPSCVLILKAGWQREFSR